VTGESGTGKEMVARCIHEFSQRNDQRFVPVNCGAIPDSLIEAELFGSEKGAYTGSHATTEGFFQSAHKGTLFLDEIGNTSENMQAKLLRVLENETVWKVGSRNPDSVDARVIAASNQSLRDLVSEGEFRADLYYRLHVISIDLPPLRDRGDDILLLTYYFVKKNAETLELQPVRISDKILDIFTSYSWPGNVRELENVLKRMMIMNETGILTVKDLPKHMLTAKMYYASNRMNMSLDDIEKEHIAEIYKHNNGNKTQAAKILGVTRKTLHSKLRKYKII
jgi:transcriptional regulator with PAS, ATPase and Fis domain